MWSSVDVRQTFISVEHFNFRLYQTIAVNDLAMKVYLPLENMRSSSVRLEMGNSPRNGFIDHSRWNIRTGKTLFCEMWEALPLEEGRRKSLERHLHQQQCVATSIQHPVAFDPRKPEQVL